MQIRALAPPRRLTGCGCLFGFMRPSRPDGPVKRQLLGYTATAPHSPPSPPPPNPLLDPCPARQPEIMNGDDRQNSAKQFLLRNT